MYLPTQRKKSSIVANIVIPETLIRASRGSHDVPVHEEETQGAPLDKRSTQQSRLDSTATSQQSRFGSTAPTTPVHSYRSSASTGISEPDPAHLQDWPSKSIGTSALGPEQETEKPPRPQRPNLFQHLSDYGFGTEPSCPSTAAREEDFGPLAPGTDASVGPEQPASTVAEGEDAVERTPSQRVVEIVVPAVPERVRLQSAVAVQPHLQGSKSRQHSIAASLAHPFDHQRRPRQHSRRFSRLRKSSIYAVYEDAKKKGVRIRRARWAQLLFEYAFYATLIAIIYFVLVGRPLWKGAVWWLWVAVNTKFNVMAGVLIVLAFAVVYAYAPLCIPFEKDPPPVPAVAAASNPERPNSTSGSESLNTLAAAKTGLDTALLIPCYKSAGIIGTTLEAALKVFPAAHIFVIANGNSPTPLDNTEEICLRYGVNHIWSPIGSKIVAQFVGCYAAKAFRNVLLIDDDCLIPPNFPVVSDRLVGRVKSIGYMLKSVGPNGSRGNWCQQAQDLEYKISGLQRLFAGACGSATFPHGAISLWDREFLVRVFHDHPGFSISEDWFFGHSCRRLGGRIKMCSAVFVETETPPAVFLSSSGSSRGGFGEMTVFKQRFTRWNFFFVTGLWYNCHYILCSWKLGWWEVGAKLAVLQEFYETLLCLFTPFILPLSIAVNPIFWGYIIAGSFGLYFLNVAIFNEVHLRLKKERVAWPVLMFYYTIYKFIFMFVNVASCYWSIYKYARYFAQRYPKVVEDEKVVEVVLCMEEDARAVAGEKPKSASAQGGLGGRRFTVATVHHKEEV